MVKKPTYTELEQRIQELEKEESDRIQAEEALRESKEKYLTILDGIEDSYLEVDISGNFQFFNNSFCKMLGLSRNELIGRNYQEFVDEPTANTIFQIFQNVYETAKPAKEVGWEFSRKDGTKRNVEVSISLVTDSNDERIGFRGIARDITDRKKTEETLQKMASVVKYSRELINLATMEGKMIFLNDAGSKMLGIDPDEVERFNIMDVIPDELQELVRTELLPSLLEGNTWNGELQYRNIKTDDLTCVYAMAFTVKDPNTKKALFLANVSIDITDRKQAEEALRESETRFRELFNSINDIVYTHDLNGRFISINPALGQYFGYDEEELIGRPLSAFMTPEFADAFEIQYLEKVKKDGHHEGTSIFVTKEGHEIHIEFRSSMVYPKEGEPYISGTGRDVTERILSERDKHKLQAQLTQAQKMESVGILAGGIAHDFNNILAAILGYSELALVELPPEASIRNKLEAIRSSGMRARDLVTQILSFSRKDEQIRSPIGLHLIVKDALKLLRPAIPTTIDIQTQKVSECRILGDPSRIHQVIMNLCTNAYQAMLESGGILGISLLQEKMEGEIAVRTGAPRGEYAKMVISDTGVGIPPESISRIFEPYFTTKEKGKGTGLGLAAVHGIVKSHGGSILVKSQIGKGSIFEVYLPLTQDKNDDGKRVKTQLPVGNERILLIDDEHDVLEIEKEMLDKLGYNTTGVDRAREALSLFARHPNRFDLVLTDMTMPKLTGDKFAGELRKIRSDILIILVTGFSELISKEKAESMGINGFLMKPVLLSDMARMVRKVLDEGKDTA